MAFHLYSRGRALGVYLQNAPIFPTNLIPDIREGFNAIWNISIITTTTSIFEYTIDGGVTFFPLGTATANEELVANIKADNKDSFNLRITDVGGGTVFRIIVSIAPEDIQRSKSELATDVNIVSPIPLPVSLSGQPISVDICPVTCTVPVDIQNQPITVSQSANPLPVSFAQPISVDVLSFLPDPLPVSFAQPITVTQSANPLPVDICPVTCTVPVDIQNQPISVDVLSFLPNPLPVSFVQPITVTQSANPLPVDICPVTCEIDVDINSISFGTIPVSITGQPISVTETADPKNVAITGQPIQVDIFAQSFSPLLVDICPVTCDVPVINGSVSPLKVNVENPVGTPIGGTLVTLTNSAITADTDIFTAFTPTGTSTGDAVMFRIQWTAQDKGVLSYTLNNSDFVLLNDGNDLDQDTSHIFDILVDDPDLFTLRFSEDTTITFLRVVQLV